MTTSAVVSWKQELMENSYWNSNYGEVRKILKQRHIYNVVVITKKRETKAQDEENLVKTDKLTVLQEKNASWKAFCNIEANK